MVGAEGADAGFDFEESGGLVKYLRWKVGGLHDFFAGAKAVCEGLEDKGFDIGVADEVLLFELFVLFDVTFGEEKFENVARLSVGNGTLLNELVAPLGIGASDIAWDSEDILALFKSVGSGIERARALGSFDYNDNI